MVEKMTGLFGPSPYEVQQARNQQMNTSAENFAQMNATQRGVMGMYKGGAGLAGMGAGMMGMVDPAVEQAQQMSAAAQGVDTSTPEGLIEFAKKVQAYAPGKAAEAISLARKMKMENEAATLATRKEDRADRELTEVKIAGVANKMQIEKDRLAANIARWVADANNDSLSIEQRREAAKLASTTKLEMERMDNEARLKGISLRQSYGGDAQPGKIDFSRMKDSDKWRIIKEQGADKAAIGSATSQSNDVVKLANSLLNHPGLPSITGWSALTNVAALPNSPAKGALTLLESLKSKAATVGRALASESGKLGNMALGEWKLVAEDIANLDPKSPEFPSQVQRIVDKTVEMESRLRQNYEETYSVYEGLNPALSASTLPPPRIAPPTQAPAAPGGQAATQPNPAFAGVTTPMQVKQLYQAGKMSKAQAKIVLADMDARGVK